MPAQLLIENVSIVAVESGEVLPPQSVLIIDGQITAIGKKASRKAPAKTTKINGTGKYLMPGLIDAHIHLFQSGGLYARPDALDLRSVRSYEAERAWTNRNMQDFLQRYLAAGITQVCDMGGPVTQFVALSKLQANNVVLPEVHMTGPLIASHQPEALAVPNPPIELVLSQEKARELVRAQLPYKPSYIKIWYIAHLRKPAEEYLPIVKATIEESHAHGLPVAVHATELKTARLAVEAGADILVHSIRDNVVNQAFIDLLQEKNVSYVP
ncbi:MAG: amidohydrolase family protein, partial [Bacteroidota bacterium]